MKNIPNFFTLLNLVFGCIAIVCILQTGETIVQLDIEGFVHVQLPEKITWGALFIFGAAIVDFLDGFIARLFKSTSAMGKQLDSLADVVSFGVAPGLILYQLLRISLAQEEGAIDASVIGLLPALLIPCAAAWRLAKFNIDETQQYSFKGLPTPAAGITIASFPLITWFQNSNIQFLFTNKWYLYGFIVLLAFLMVSNIPMMSLKIKNFAIKNNIPKILLLLISVIAAILFQWLAIPIILVSYVVLSLIFKNINE